MQVKNGVFEFEWDEANIQKSYFKHGVTPKETEEVFFDEDSKVIPDQHHSDQETRHIIVGKNAKNTNLFIVFTIRRSKIRVISARHMHAKEVSRYEKIKTNTSI